MSEKHTGSRIRREVLTFKRDGIDFALHLWAPPVPRGAIFYLHGLQSHAGWLWEVGCQFAANGIAFYALDRRGCGISGGERNEIPDVDTLLGDVGEALRIVRDRIGPDIPLGLFGHCLGGSVLAGLLHHDAFDVPHDVTIFCSSWLGRIHTVMDEDQRRSLRSGSRDTTLWDAGLRAVDFTDKVKYQSYIDTDPLATRQITTRSRTHLLHLEELYLRDGKRLPAVPTAFISGESDPVIDLTSSRSLFNSLLSSPGQDVRFAADKHYLFFTDARPQVVDWASAYTAGRGDVHHA